MEFGNKQIMWKHHVAANNDCAPPLGAPSEMRIAKQKAQEKQKKVETYREEIEHELKELRETEPELFKPPQVHNEEPEELIEQVKYNII